MIQSKQIELVPINRALRELRQLCVDTNEHTRQSKSVPGSIHSRATTHSPSKRGARDSKPRRRRSPSSSDAPIFSGHSCAIAGFVRKNFIYAQHTPVPRRTHRQSHRITRHLYPARLRARFAADPRNSRFANIIPPSPPPSSPRAHAPNLSRNLPPPSLPEVRASSPRSSPPSRAVCLRTPILFPSRRRRVILPLVVALVPRSRRDASRPTTQTFLARLRPLYRAFARHRARGRRRGVTTAVGPRLVSRRSRARGPIQTRTFRPSRSVGHTREREREREGHTYIPSLSASLRRESASARDIHTFAGHDSQKTETHIQPTTRIGRTHGTLRALSKHSFIHSFASVGRSVGPSRGDDTRRRRRW